MCSNCHQAEELLIFGYIRNVKHLTLFESVIPKDIIKICFKLYYDPEDKMQNYLEWTVSNNNNNNKDISKGLPLVLKHCQFRIYGVNKSIYLKLMHHTHSLTKISIYYQLIVNVDDKEFKISNIASFYVGNINNAFKQILKKNSNNKTKTTSITAATTTRKRIKLFEFGQSESAFSAQLFAKILRIEHNNHKFIDFYTNQHMFAKFKCKWNVSYNWHKLNNNCWCLRYDEEKENESIYELILLYLPNGISKINVKLSFNVTTIKRKGRRKQKSHSFIQHKKHMFSFSYNRFKWISQNKDILNLSLEIIEIYDMNQQCVDHCDWNLYHINSNQHWLNIHI